MKGQDALGERYRDGRTVVLFRAWAGWSRAKLARESSVPAATLAAVENGRVELSEFDRCRLLRSLGLPCRVWWRGRSIVDSIVAHDEAAAKEG